MASCTQKVGVSVRKHAAFRVTACTGVRESLTACAGLVPVLVRVSSRLNSSNTEKSVKSDV